MPGRFTVLTTFVLGIVTLALVASAVSQWIPGTDEELTTEVFTPSTRVRVDVRNAAGVAGWARTVTQRLRRAGFDVVDFGNARSFDLDSSVVIDRVGNLQDAASVAEVLGIRRVVSEPDSNLFVDVTVRVGADWSPQAVVLEQQTGQSWLARFLGRMSGPSATGDEGES